MSGGMAAWTSLLLLMLGMMLSVEVTGEGYDLVLLLPLSGREAARGRGLEAGVRLALPPGTNHSLPVTLVSLQGVDGGGSVHVRIHYTDTQCDRVTEDAAAWRHLESSTRPLVVVGGMCPQTLQDPDAESLQQSLYFRQNIPQVTFVESFTPSSPLVVSPVTIQPSVRSAYRPLVSWLRTMGCRHVALLSTSRQAAVHRETQVLKEQMMDSKFKIALQVETSNPNVPYLLRQSQSRVVLLQADADQGLQQLCHLVRQTGTTPGRFLWVLLVRDVTTSSMTSLRPCINLKDYTIVIFSVQSFGLYTQEYEAFRSKLLQHDPEVLDAMTPEAAVAFDTMALTLRTLSTLHKVVPRMSRQQFTDRFIRELTRGSEGHVAGGVWFDEYGNRDAVVNLHILNDDGIYASNGTMGGVLPLEYSQVERQVSLQGVPLAAFVVMTSLAFLGMTYAVLILVFNLLKRNDKMIKMTSPNINTVILLGAMMGYVSMVTLGLDSSRVSLTSMAKLVQASMFLLAVGYSLVFGSLFAKAWRVFFIFKNLNANGKNTRDEHLLFGVTLLVVADLIVLVPWAAADPITCTHTFSSAVYQPTPPTDVIVQSDACASSLQVMWVLVLYVLKGGVLVVGLYFTYQSRHVSLPTLKDAREVYEVVYTLGVVGMLCLPVLLSPALAYSVKYTVGALAIFTVVTSTLTLCFVPKIYLLWRRSDKASPDSIRFLFSESLRRTQRHLASCSRCCPLAGGGGEDKYAQEVLGSEIETLKRTIKEKDATIRELTDRLYFGTEKKLHEYISSPRRLQLANVEGASVYQQRMQSPSQEPGSGSIAHVEGQLPVTSASAENMLDTSSPSESSDIGAYRSYCRRSRRSERHRRRSPHGVVPPSGRRTYYDLEEGEEERSSGLDSGVQGDERMVVGHNGVLLQSPVDAHYQQNQKQFQQQQQYQQQHYNPHEQKYQQQQYQQQEQQYHQQEQQCQQHPQQYHQQEQQCQQQEHEQQQYYQQHRKEDSIPPGTPRMYQEDNGIPQGLTMGPYTPHILHTNPYTHHTPVSEHVTKYSTPSPNHDSAIDNNSPSSAGSDQEMLQQHLQYTPVGTSRSGKDSVSWRQGGLDLEAIEKEVTHVGGYHYIPNVSKGVSSYIENGVAVSQI